MTEPRTFAQIVPCHEERGNHLHSEADRATSFLGAVRVTSFAQGFLQEKENVTEIHKLMPYSSKSYLRKLTASRGGPGVLSSYLENEVIL